jgi:hypothetical protein
LHVLRAPRPPARPVRSTYRAGVVTSKRTRPLRERMLLRRLGSAVVVPDRIHRTHRRRRRVGGAKRRRPQA